MPNTISIVIEPDGIVRHLVNDNAPELDGLGEVVDVYRSSHVEIFSDLSDSAKMLVMIRHGLVVESTELATADPKHWWVDLTPVEGGDVFGPFPSHKAAIDFEIQWLQDRHLPPRVD